jgi:uncharacterized protein (DUF1810 family)
MQSESSVGTDPFNLRRFVDAQEPSFAGALSELRGGRKRGHWMWFIFPQIHGLGRSVTAQFYAIQSLGEAQAYLAHPVLGPRLHQCAEALLGIGGRSVADIFGSPDDAKLRSCMTLFARVSDEGSVFHAVLDQYFSGQHDPKTLAILGRDASDGGTDPE